MTDECASNIYKHENNNNMRNNKFRGLGTALVTPFDDTGNVDFEALGRLVDFQLENGVNFLCLLGTTAETPTLCDSEKAEIIEFALGRIAKRVPVLLGCSSNDTAHLVKDIKKYSEYDVDGFLSVVPYYNKPTQKGIYRHFEAVCNSTDKPIVIYNIPGRTGVNVSAETVHDLFRNFGNIIGIKEASGNLPQIDSLISDRPEDFCVLSGDDSLTYPIMSLGGDGVISVASNACPVLMSNLVSALERKDYAAAVGYHHALLPINKLLFKDGNPAGIKALLEIKGMIKNRLRLPLVPVEPDTYEALAKYVNVL